MTRRHSGGKVPSDLISCSAFRTGLSKGFDEKVTTVTSSQPADDCGSLHKAFGLKRWILALTLCFMRMCHATLLQDMRIALICMTQEYGGGSKFNSTPGRSALLSNESLAYGSDSNFNTSAGRSAALSNESSGSGANSKFITSTRRSAMFGNKSSTSGTVNAIKVTGEFTWSSMFEGLVLSAPNYGFVLAIPLAGYLDQMMGSCRLLVLSLSAGGILSLLTPPLTRRHTYLLVTIRVLTGAANSLVKPAVFSLWAKWAPVPELGTLTAIEYSGSSVGAILTFFISGFLCSIPYDNGWPLVFYVFGMLSVLCAVILANVIYDHPDNHPSINSVELNFISANRVQDVHKGLVRPPWMKLMKSPAVWAIVIAHTSHDWICASLLACLPMYMRDILHYDIAENGVLSALPYVGSMMAGLVGGAMSDRLQRYVPVVYVRKLLQFTGSVGFALLVFIVSWLDASLRSYAVTLLVGAITLLNLTSVAYRINSLDIAPRFVFLSASFVVLEIGYSSFIMSFSCTVATAVSLTAPMATTAILGTKSVEEWQKVLYISTAVSLVGGVIYVIFSRGSVQSWASSNTYDVTAARSEVTVGHLQQSMPSDSPSSRTCVVLSVQRLRV